MHLLREFGKVLALISFQRRHFGFDRKEGGEQYKAGRRIADSQMSCSLRRPRHRRIRHVSLMSEKCLLPNVLSLCLNLNVEPYVFEAKQASRRLGSNGGDGLADW